MALQFSLGFKQRLLDGVSGGSLKTIFDDGYIAVYSGAVPASPDDSIGAAVVMNVYSDSGAAEGAGNGLDLEAASSNGGISKASAQTWSGTSTAGSTATFFRYYQIGDSAQGASTTAARIQGTVGPNGDLFVSSSTFIISTGYSLDLFSISIPNL